MTTTTASRHLSTSADPRSDAVGLHGHGIGPHKVQAAAAELVGTFVLVLTIVSTAIAATLSRPVAGSPYDSLSVPLAGGFALVAIVASIGHLSGAHVNPAVTVGLALSRRFPWRHVPFYLGAQFAGGIVAAFAAWVLYGSRARSDAGLAATVPAAGIGGGRVFAAEAIVTFVLVGVVVAVATDSRVPQGVAAISVGFALAMAIFISGPISGAGVNPARALGPMIVAGKFTDWWAYLSAPLAGGAVAATFWALVNGTRDVSRGHHPDAGLQAPRTSVADRRELAT
jgi:aquaporin Z/aquaporin NIP